MDYSHDFDIARDSLGVGYLRLLPHPTTISRITSGEMQSLTKTASLDISKMLIL